MTKYIEVTNDNSVVTIDGLYRNLCLKRKIKLSEITKESYPITAMQAGEVFIGIGNPKNNNVCTGYEYELLDRINNTHHFQEYTEYFNDCYLYYWGEYSTAQGNCGLQVFNETNQVIFDSNQLPANVVYMGHNSFPDENILHGDRQYCWCQGCTTFMQAMPKQLGSNIDYSLAMAALFWANVSHYTYITHENGRTLYKGLNLFGVETATYNDCILRPAEYGTDQDRYTVTPYGDNVYLIMDVTNY